MRNYIILFLLTLTLVTSVNAYSFMNYGHNALWNETAECPSGLCATWTGTPPTVETTQKFNGTSGIQIPNAFTYSDTSYASANFNLTYFIYSPSTTLGTGSAYIGLRDDTVQGCSGDGKGFSFGYSSATSTTQWSYCTAGTWTASGITVTSGWHQVDINREGTNYKFYFDGVNLKNGTDSKLGSYITGYSNIGGIYYDDLHAWNGTLNLTLPKSLTIIGYDIITGNAITGIVVNATIASGLAQLTYTPLLNGSATVFSGCTGGMTNDQCYEEIVLNSAKNGNTTRLVGGNLTVPWFSSSSVCTQNDLQTGSNCNIGTVNFSQYCMVTDELSLHGLWRSMSSNVTKWQQFYNTLIMINSTQYGQLPAWRIFVNETTSRFYPYDSRTNSNNDTASDADARFIIALYTAANNSNFNASVQASAFSLAQNLSRDFYKYELNKTCFNSALGNGQVCYWLAAGSVANTNGMDSTDFGYSGYYADAIIAMLLAGQYNTTYNAVAGNLTQNYLIAAGYDGTSFRVPTGRSFKWQNVSAGNYPYATCTNTCSPDKWDSVDAPRAFGMGEALYYSNLTGITLPNLTAYMTFWNTRYLSPNNNSVPIQYYTNGTMSDTNQSGYFSQGLQTAATMYINQTLTIQALTNALGHYASASTTWDYAACFGTYQQSPAIRAYGEAIGRTLPAISPLSTYGTGSTTTYTNTTGTTITINNTGVYNFTIQLGNGTYFGVNYTAYNFSGTTNINAYSSQALISLASYQLFTNALINRVNATINTVSNGTLTGYVSLPAVVGSNNIFVNASGNYTKNVTCTVTTGLTITVCNATGIYDSLLTVGASEIGVSSINNFTIYPINASFTISNYTTTNGSVYIPLLQNYYYTLLINSSFYAYANTTLLINNRTQLYNFSLYTANSFSIVFYNETTNQVLNNVNITLQLISNIYANNYSTSNGTLLITLLTPADYTIRYWYEPTIPREYYTTLLPQSFTNISLYLLDSGVSTTYLPIVTDQNTVPLSAARIQLLRAYIVNNQYQYNVVEMETTDTNGQAVLRVVPNTINYKLLITSGTISFTTQPTKFTSSTNTYLISPSTTALTSILNNQNVQDSLTYNNATQTYVFTWYDANNIVTSGCLQVTKSGKNTLATSVYNTCLNAAGGSLTYTITDTNQTRYSAKAMITTNTIFSNYFIGEITNDFTTDQAIFGRIGMVLLLMALLAVCFMVNDSGSDGTIIASMIVLLLFGFVGIIAYSWPIFLGIFIFGGIIVYKTRR